MLTPIMLLLFASVNQRLQFSILLSNEQQIHYGEVLECNVLFAYWRRRARTQAYWQFAVTDSP